MKRIWILFAVLLALLICPVSVLADESEVQFSAVITPDGIPAGGKVGVVATVEMAENAAYRMEAVKLYQGNTLVAQADSVQPADARALTGVITVADNQVGGTVTLTLRWSENGTPYTKKVEVPIKKADVTPKVAMDRTYTQDTNDATRVVLKYVLQNNGTAYLTDLKITDMGLTVATQAELFPGATSTMTYTYAPKAGQESAPVLSYRAYGKTYTLELEPMLLQVREAQVQVLLESDVISIVSGERHTLQCTILNSGNVAYTDLQVVNVATGEVLYTAASLPAGASRAFSNTYTPTAQTQYQYQVCMKDDRGEACEYLSNVVTVAVEAAPVQQVLDIAVSASTTMLDTPGDVTFYITVTNRSDAVIDTVLVTDDAGNVITTIEHLAPGSQIYQYVQNLSASCTMLFHAAMHVGTPAEQKVSALPLVITVKEGHADVSVLPNATPAPNGGGKNATGLIVLLIVGIVVLLAAMVFLGAQLVRSKPAAGTRGRRRR